MQREEPAGRHFGAVTRAAQHVWLTVAFVFIWLHFAYARPNLRRPDWQLYSLYFISVAGVACRYLTGIRYGHTRWHRVLFDSLTILFVAVGVSLTGGIRSDLWLVYFIFVIAETLAASARGFLITDLGAVASYVIATWPHDVAGLTLESYFEPLVTRIFFLMLVASIARTIAWEERERQEDLGALREALAISEERRRLARELHDGIGHVLTRVILSLEFARRQCSVDPQAGAQTVSEQADALRGAMEEMRQVVATLRTDTAAYDLQSAVRGMEAQLGSGTFHVDAELPEHALPLSPHRQYHLSRVIQEALTNCLRHADASEARVEVRVVSPPVGVPKVVAVVSDRGRGFEREREDHRGGHGLRGMEERLAPYGGRVTVESAPGQGTRVTAELPADVGEWWEVEKPAARAR